MMGLVFLTAYIAIVTSWLQGQGVIELANEIRGEFLIGTANTDSAQWGENDPTLVTAYDIIALTQAGR